MVTHYVHILDSEVDGEKYSLEARNLEETTANIKITPQGSTRVLGEYFYDIAAKKVSPVRVDSRADGDAMLALVKESLQEVRNTLSKAH